jgi:hypothetical protein
MLAAEPPKAVIQPNPLKVEVAAVRALLIARLRKRIDALDPKLSQPEPEPKAKPPGRASWRITQP